MILSVNSIIEEKANVVVFMGSFVCVEASEQNYQNGYQTLILCIESSSLLNYCGINNIWKCSSTHIGGPLSCWSVAYLPHLCNLATVLYNVCAT